MAAQNNNMEFIIMIITAVILLIPLGYGVVSLASSNDTQPFIEKPDEKYDKCVRDTEYMRLNHMDLLKEIRDDAMRRGKRGEITLNDCRKCHTSRERFCDKCHNVVNAQLDCYGCHYFPK